MRLLKKDTPFIWDEQAQASFEKLKYALTHAPLIHPLDYQKYFILYLAASSTTIAMVLVQQTYDEEGNVVYYLSKSLLGPETRYCHVDKLALAAVFVVQQFLHYILLRKMTIIFDANHMYHILTWQVLGGKYSRWIFILQEFELEFSKSKSRNLWSSQS